MRRVKMKERINTNATKKQQINSVIANMHIYIVVNFLKQLRLSCCHHRAQVVFFTIEFYLTKIKSQVINKILVTSYSIDKKKNEKGGKRETEVK